MANNDVIWFTNTSSSTSNLITTNGVWSPNTVYTTYPASQPAQIFHGPTGVDIVALPVDTSDDPIAWLKGRVEELQDCWKEAA